MTPERKRGRGVDAAVIGAILATLAVAALLRSAPSTARHSQEPPSVPPPQAVEPLRLEERDPLVPAPPAAPAPADTFVSRAMAAVVPVASDDEIRSLLGCADKRCGDPCVLPCDPADGRCTPQGIRAGACASDGTCSYVLPAVCP
jgi:hypothetical protein